MGKLSLGSAFGSVWRVLSDCENVSVALVDLKLNAGTSHIYKWAHRMPTMIHFDFGFNTRTHEAKTKEEKRAMEKHVDGIFRSLIVNYTYAIRATSNGCA